MATVIVVDDHPIARTAVRFILEKEGHSVIAESGDGLETLSLVAQHIPDVLLVDIDIHSKNGIDVTRSLRARDYQGIILVISGKNLDFYAAQSLRSGANGFISKKNNLNKVITAIQVAQNGYGYFPMSVFEHQQPASSDEQFDKKLIDSLSPQEFKVFNFMLNGMDNMQIAGRMGLSNKTVSTYKTRMMEKLQCKSLRDLYAFAHRNRMGAE